MYTALNRLMKQPAYLLDLSLGFPRGVLMRLLFQ